MTSLWETKLLRRLMPVFLFPTLSALGAKTIFTRGLIPLMITPIQERCAPGATFDLSYTGLGAIDGTLCGMIAFFDASLQSISKPYTAHLLFNLAPLTIFMLAEGIRPGAKASISAFTATLIALAYQLFSAAAITPLYWTLFTLSGQAVNLRPLSSARAEAIVFGFFTGFILPTCWMIGTANPYAIALWQAFPLWMYLAQKLYLFARPAGYRPTDGQKIIEALYIFTIIPAVLSHYYVIFASLNGLEYSNFLPQYLEQDQMVDLAWGARNFLQFDGLFTHLAAMTASLWFARTIQEVITIAIWHALCILTLGPGAALATVYAWRERQVKG